MKGHWYLAPLSWVYGLITDLRNKLFDWKILSSEEFTLPVISVGNITVGGTGKTPFSEYLIRLLKDEQHVAFLSRGYKRKTHGYVLADTNSTARIIGDEPRQIKRKFPDVHVAVDAKRRRGIHHLCDDAATSNTEVVLLDDAYQHRQVTPGVNILLVDYNRMPNEDRLLPNGRLREAFHNRDRAHIIVVTKCPEDIRPIDFRIIQNHLELRPYQRLYFSICRYGLLRPILSDNPHDDPQAESPDSRSLSNLSKDTSILLVTGIARPQPIVEELKKHTDNVVTMSFPDHHDFRSRDIKRIDKAFSAITATDKMIITTEKDAVRLIDNPKADALKPYIYVLPIEIEFLRDQAESFNNYIISYVRKNSRNSIVHKGANAHRT